MCSTGTGFSIRRTRLPLKIGAVEAPGRIASAQRLHVFADLGNELGLLLAQALDQPLGDIALICIKPAKQIAAQEGDRLAVIDIAGGEFHAQQFAAMVDCDMQLSIGCIEIG